MELYYDENGIKELSEKIKNIGKRLDETISTYATVCYEILKEINVADVNLKSDINVVKNSLEEGFIFVKKQEMFLEEVIYFYNGVNKKTESETKKLETDMFMGGYNDKPPAESSTYGTNVLIPDVFVPFVAVPKIIKI